MPSRRRRFRSRPKQEKVKRPPANNEIRVPEVRLIGVDGEQLGVVSIEDARARAEEVESDLVMVAQKAQPPVVRIMDLGKHVYEVRKKLAKQKVKSKGGDIKGVRIGFKIGEHDLGVRLKQADGFLDEGHKVKVEMRLRGREKGRVELAVQKLQAFVDAVPGGAKMEESVSRSGNSVSAVITRDRSRGKQVDDETETE